MTANERAREYIQSRTAWEFSGVCDLGETTWAAYATTTHHATRGEEEMTFAVLGNLTTYITLDTNELRVLRQWIE
ncbi:MAG: hypothetical protein ACRDZY_13360, partial [Acidimicrobiales bacterium]